MMAGLTDEEMAALEAKQASGPAAPPGGLTDEQLRALETKQVPAEPSRMDRVVGYLKSIPGRIADTATSTDTVPSFATGLTYGALPKLSAAVETAPEVLKAATGNESDVGGTYTRALQRLQPLYDGAVSREPVAHLAGLSAAPNPFGRLAAFGRAGRLAAAAGQGELYGLASSKEKDVSGVLRDTAQSGGVGLLAAGAAEVPRAIADGFGALKARGYAAAESAQAKTAAKDLASERGRLGGISVGSLGDLEKAKAAVNNPALEQADRDWFAQWLQSPEALETERRAAANLKERLPSRFGEMGEARGAMDAAAANAEPSAISAATQEKLGESMLLKEVLPRVDRLVGNKALSMIGEFGGAPITTTKNLLKAPLTQYRVGQVGEAISSPVAGAAAAAARGTPTLADYLKRKPDEEREADGAEAFMAGTTR